MNQSTGEKDIIYLSENISHFSFKLVLILAAIVALLFLLLDLRDLHNIVDIFIMYIFFFGLVLCIGTLIYFTYNKFPVSAQIDKDTVTIKRPGIFNDQNVTLPRSEITKIVYYKNLDLSPTRLPIEFGSNMSDVSGINVFLSSGEKVTINASLGDYYESFKTIATKIGAILDIPVDEA
jgi:hypothetical protein